MARKIADPDGRQLVFRGGKRGRQWPRGCHCWPFCLMPEPPGVVQCELCGLRMRGSRVSWPHVEFSRDGSAWTVIPGDCPGREVNK